MILAGGEGRRIGGTKPVRQLAGERLIDRALRHARAWSTEQRSLRGLATLIGFREVEWPAAPHCPFFNINTAEELAEAESRASG